MAQERIPRVSQLLTWLRPVFLVFLIFLRGSGAYSSCFSTFYMAHAHAANSSCFSSFYVTQARVPRVSQLFTWDMRIFLAFLYVAQAHISRVYWLLT